MALLVQRRVYFSTPLSSVFDSSPRITLIFTMVIPVDTHYVHYVDAGLSRK